MNFLPLDQPSSGGFNQNSGGQVSAVSDDAGPDWSSFRSSLERDMDFGRGKEARALKPSAQEAPEGAKDGDTGRSKGSEAKPTEPDRPESSEPQAGPRQGSRAAGSPELEKQDSGGDSAAKQTAAAETDQVSDQKGSNQAKELSSGAKIQLQMAAIEGAGAQSGGKAGELLQPIALQRNSGDLSPAMQKRVQESMRSISLAALVGGKAGAASEAAGQVQSEGKATATAQGSQAAAGAARHLSSVAGESAAAQLVAGDRPAAKALAAPATAQSQDQTAGSANAARAPVQPDGASVGRGAAEALPREGQAAPATGRNQAAAEVGTRDEMGKLPATRNAEERPLPREGAARSASRPADTAASPNGNSAGRDPVELLRSSRMEANRLQESGRQVAESQARSARAADAASGKTVSAAPAARAEPVAPPTSGPVPASSLAGNAGGGIAAEAGSQSFSGSSSFNFGQEGRGQRDGREPGKSGGSAESFGIDRASGNQAAGVTGKAAAAPAQVGQAMQRIIESINTLQQQAHQSSVSLSVDLKNGESLRVSLQIVKQQVKVVFSNESESMRIALRENWDQLQKQVLQKGLDADLPEFEGEERNADHETAGQNEDEADSSAFFGTGQGPVTGRKNAVPVDTAAREIAAPEGSPAPERGIRLYA